MSKAIAVEICGAIPGAYLISVLEHGNFDYRLSVSGDDGTGSNQGNEAQDENLHADGDRVCHFRFNFRMAKGKVAIQWLDKTGRPLGFSSTQLATRSRELESCLLSVVEESAFHQVPRRE